MTQAEFTAALLDPARPAPEGLSSPGGGAPGKRFDVYRNNVVVSLMEALAAGFPAVAALMGGRFKPMSAAYARAHPPDSPLMTRYGRRMPEFLADEPELSDLARLELALRDSYHAPDAPALDPARLTELPPDELMKVRLATAPATRVLRSRWPVASLWTRALRGGSEAPDRGEAVLVTRPGFDPEPHVLPPGAATFILALEDATLSDAVVRAEGTAPDFDLTATLALMLRTGALTDMTETT